MEEKNKRRRGKVHNKEDTGKRKKGKDAKKGEKKEIRKDDEKLPERFEKRRKWEKI